MNKKSEKQPVVRDAAFYAAIGRKGGNQTKNRMLAKNPNYFAEIGLKGGQSMLKTRGKEFFSTIGKMGKHEEEL